MALAATLACVLTVMGPAAPGGATPAPGTGRLGDPAQSEPTVDVLEVTSVSPWVAPSGTFKVSFDTEGLPPDATVTTTIHQRVRPQDGSLREALTSELDSDTPSKNLQAPVAVALSALATGNGSAEIQIPIRPNSGDPARQLIPNAGIHPVSIEVTAPAGSGRPVVMAATRVFLNRLPKETPRGRDGNPATTTVQLLAGLDSGPALGPNGQMDLSTEERLAVSAWQGMLEENSELPLTVALRPNTLLALQRSDEPNEASFVADLAATSFTVAPQSYVRVDAAGLADTGSGALAGQLDAGSTILATVTGRKPDGPWMLDDTVDTEVAERLHRRGVTHLIVSEDRLETLGDRSDESPGVLKRNRTLSLADVEGMTVSSYDAQVTRILLEPETPAGLRAHRATTAMMASWFDAVQLGSSTFPGVSSGIVLSSATDHEVLARLVNSLSGSGPLVIAAPSEPTADADGRPVAARLRARESDVSNATVRRWQVTATRIDGFASMSSAGDTAGAELDLLNDETLALGADATTRNSIWNQIDVHIDERLAMIQTPPPRSVVLTSRSGSIPLRIRNRGDLPVTVRLTTRSPRLEFPAGPTRDVLLTPGENRIDIPVDVQAPGSSLLRIDVSSPDGTLDVREVQVTVRSSSISGVGAALSIISLCVLAFWWIRTVRSRRTRKPGPEATATSTSGTGSGDGP